MEFAGEARQSQRDVPLAIILSIVVGLFIYLLLEVAFIGATPSNMLSGGWEQVRFDSPWAGAIALTAPPRHWRSRAPRPL